MDSHQIIIKTIWGRNTLDGYVHFIKNNQTNEEILLGQKRMHGYPTHDHHYFSFFAIEFFVEVRIQNRLTILLQQTSTNIGIRETISQ